MITSAEEVVNFCLDKGVRLRINPDGKLTAIPGRKYTAEMREMVRKNRAEIIEFVEARDGGTELVIDDLPSVEPPPLPMGRQVIDQAAQLGIRIYLEPENARGMMKIETPWDTRGLEVADIAAAGLPAADYVNRQRTQVPSALAALINNYRMEILEELRAPFLPPAPAPDNEVVKRSIWERMSLPDNMLPGMRDNQKRVRQLLYGGNVDDVRTERRQAALTNVLPLVVRASVPESRE